MSLLLSGSDQTYNGQEGEHEEGQRDELVEVYG
jgi:hypothetical protein